MFKINKWFLKTYLSISCYPVYQNIEWPYQEIYYTNSLLLYNQRPILCRDISQIGVIRLHYLFRQHFVAYQISVQLS